MQIYEIARNMNNNASIGIENIEKAGTTHKSRTNGSTKEDRNTLLKAVK